MSGEELLLERLAELRAERDAYRLVARQAIHFCHAQHLELTRLRAGQQRLLSECRAIREQTKARELEAV